MKKTKEEYIVEGKEYLEDEEYESFKSKYLEILSKAKEERKKDLFTNSYKREEINLINRLVKYCRNYLLFLKKFFVLFSNNCTESGLRCIKIKQKTGNFRSMEGVNVYVVIKSFISIYKKKWINLYDVLKLIFTDDPIFSIKTDRIFIFYLFFLVI